MVFWMHPGKLDRLCIRRDWNAKIAERIEWRGRSDEFRRARNKDRIGRVQDAIKARGGYLLPGLHVLKLAVAESAVIAPSSVEKLVTFETDGCENRVSLIVE